MSEEDKCCLVLSARKRKIFCRIEPILVEAKGGRNMKRKFEKGVTVS